MRAAEHIYRGALAARLAENPLIDIIAETSLTEIDEDGVHLSNDATLKADWLFIAQGRDSNRDMADALEAAGVPCTLIGDALKGGRIGDAVHGAYRAVLALADPKAAPIVVAC